MTPAALRAIADAADALARLAREAAAEASDDPTALVPLQEAARVAATSLRVMRDSIRAGELPAFGRERDRAIRRSDLAAWIESRRLRPIAGRDDDAIERRVSHPGAFVDALFDALDASAKASPERREAAREWAAAVAQGWHLSDAMAELGRRHDARLAERDRVNPPRENRAHLLERGRQYTSEVGAQLLAEQRAREPSLFQSPAPTQIAASRSIEEKDGGYRLQRR